MNSDVEVSSGISSVEAANTLVEPQWCDDDFVRQYAEAETSTRNAFELNYNTLSVYNLIPGDARRVLDYGCGNGYFTEMLAKGGGIDAYGYDISPVMREIARDRDIAVLEEKDLSSVEKFDCIVLKLVLHYIDDLDSFIRQVGNYVKPGGTIVISIPNPHRTAAQYEKPYNTTFTYENELGGNFGLNCTMIHRPLSEIARIFREGGFLPTQMEELVDEERGVLPKRINIQFKQLLVE
ncbi:class I SAM-dependent methyltransferase [Candidatus Saccharibacteria bacterium]|nr:class I SAM-dependent methyltransferase [Candidatus Saccharibacteria bacterium]